MNCTSIGWVIDALEADDYERIGPSVYAKGHLKRYAALLGLPADGNPGRLRIPRAMRRRRRPRGPACCEAARPMRLAVSDLPWPQVAGSVAVMLLRARRAVVEALASARRGAGAAPPLAANPAQPARPPQPDSAASRSCVRCRFVVVRSGRVIAAPRRRRSPPAAAAASQPAPAGAADAQCDGGDGPGAPALELFRGLVGGYP